MQLMLLQYIHFEPTIASHLPRKKKKTSHQPTHVVHIVNDLTRNQLINMYRDRVTNRSLIGYSQHHIEDNNNF